MTIDVVKEEQLCSLSDKAEVLLKTPAFDATINQLVDTKCDQVHTLLIQQKKQGG